MTTRARLDVTMDADDKDIVACAAALMGSIMAGFVCTAAKEKALTLLDCESRVTQSNRDFAAFSKALDGVFKPNRKLAAALAQAKSAVRRA
jgi:uncharacterized protein (DUF1778 family)